MQKNLIPFCCLYMIVFIIFISLIPTTHTSKTYLFLFASIRYYYALLLDDDDNDNDDGFFFIK